MSTTPTETSELIIEFGPQQQYTLYVPLTNEERAQTLIKLIETAVEAFTPPRYCSTQMVFPFYK